MLRGGREAVKQISSPGPACGFLCLAGFGLGGIGGFPGQLADAIVRKTDRVVDVIAEGLLQGDLALGEPVEDGTQLK